METTIYRDIDLFYEGARLLEGLATEERPLEKKRRILEKYQIPPETVEEPFAVCEELLAAGRERLKDQMALIREYFRPCKEEGILCKATVALMAEEWRYGLGLEERRQACLALTEEERSGRFYRLVQSGYGLDVDLNEEEAKECKGLPEVLACLEGLDYGSEQKWQLLWAYQHPREAWEELWPLLETAVGIFQEKEERWRSLVETFYRNMQSCFRNQTVQEYVKEQIGVSLDENPLGIVIVPQILGGLEAALVAGLPQETGGKACQDICRIGVIVQRLEREMMVETGIRQKQIASLMKLLADESKLEILSLLRERRYYGGELARKLELTTATISHHMSGLVSAGLVRVSKEGNRMYYETNEPMVRRLLESTGELLLHTGA